MSCRVGGGRFGNDKIAGASESQEAEPSFILGVRGETRYRRTKETARKRETVNDDKEEEEKRRSLRVFDLLKPKPEKKKRRRSAGLAKRLCWCGHMTVAYDVVVT